MKKCCLAVVCAMFILGLVSIGALADGVTVDINNARFFKGETEEVFVATGGNISAELPANAPVGTELMLIAAVYEEDRLSDVSYKIVTTEETDSVLKTEPVTLSSDESVMKVMVWATDYTPYSNAVVLDDKSWEKKIESFDIKMTGASTQVGETTYTGYVNEDESTVFVDVPTTLADGSGNAVADNALLKATEYAAQITSVQPIVTVSQGATVASSVMDLSSSKNYVVTAENGTTRTYSVTAAQSVLKRRLTVDDTTILMQPNNAYFKDYRAGMPTGVLLGTGYFRHYLDGGSFAYNKSTPVDAECTTDDSGYWIDSAGNYVPAKDNKLDCSLEVDPTEGKVFRFFKSGTNNMYGIKSITGHTRPTMSKMVFKTRFKYDNMNKSGGTRVMIANIYNLIGVKAGEDHDYFKFMSRVNIDDGSSVSIANSPELKIDQWHDLATVATITPTTEGGAAKYSVDLELYIDGSYVTTLSHTYSEDVHFAAQEFAFSGMYGQTYGASIKSAELTYISR